MPGGPWAWPASLSVDSDSGPGLWTGDPPHDQTSRSPAVSQRGQDGGRCPGLTRLSNEHAACPDFYVDFSHSCPFGKEPDTSVYGAVGEKDPHPLCVLEQVLEDCPDENLRTSEPGTILPAFLPLSKKTPNLQP